MRFHQVMASIAAFLFASLAFSATFSFVTFWQVPFRLTVVLAHALVLGLPIFLIFWWKRWVNVITCICAGFIVAAASGVLPNVPRFSPGRNESVRGVPRYVDGVPTEAAWTDFWQILIFLGFFGAIAGLVFWGTLMGADALAPAGGRADSSGQARQRAPGTGHATVLAVVAVALVGILLGTPNAVWGWLARFATDRTCHNVLRDRDSISPRINMVLELASEEAPKLTQAMKDFAATHKLQFRDAEGAPVRSYVSACNDRLTIQAAPWGITVFELQPESGWQQLTKDLIDRIEALWPGKLRFRAPEGGYMPRPKELE